MEVTEKQFQVIRRIERNLGIKFSGSTRMEATEFISVNMAYSLAAAEKERSMYLEERIREDEAEERDMDEFFFQ